MLFETWTTVPVRSAGILSHTKQQQQRQQYFKLLCIGGCCVACQNCDRRNLISPSAHSVPLCVSCRTPLELSLEAHFACTARLEKPFAIVQAFDIEDFLAETAHELCERSRRRRAERGDGGCLVAAHAVVGFVDVKVWRSCDALREQGQKHSGFGSWKHIAKRGGGGGMLQSMLASFGLRISKDAKNCDGGGTASVSKKHALAVLVDGMLSFYAVRKRVAGVVPGTGKHWLRNSLYEQIFSLPLDSVRMLGECTRSSKTGLSVRTSSAYVEMSVGVPFVAKTWIHMLSERADLSSMHRDARHQHQHQHYYPHQASFYA
ncbi:hypothetical protein GGI11_008104 [Coemansia sp. RSA 2049]|nr:hypothetical protein GGI11_008104 [Coemansia sp. RSA 2049]KAJ2522157.1 hypothetical protein H4217_000928 [Coemansia sp. RSA 1939]KAJ2616299.1 hypothetical protein EV177_001129 [Coemansia sp. RSA 1804]KAJ2668197.1 hypothetical protein GGH99_006491 [Coemansia sp. RSA 1285]